MVAQNPPILFKFIDHIFAGLGIGTLHSTYIQALIMVVGVVLGSALWWVILSATVTFFLHKLITDFYLKIINRSSGITIILFGIFALKVFV
ncbi:MAG: LysE family transporter [Gammaproteobacteria bacterium]|nr:LysE family transporter [Gammaproteobacteria bacterium]